MPSFHDCLEFLSISWMLKNVLNLSDEQVEQIQEERRRAGMTPLQLFTEDTWKDD